MTFEVITMWYNEEFLAPFFLNHYWQAKQITIFYDNATRDNTLEEIANHNESIKVKLQTINLDQGLDEFRKIRYINEAYKRSKCDYVIVADADEFVFYEDCRFKRRIYWCALAQIMRTPYDPELDSRLPIDTWSYGFQEKLMIKPSIIRTGLKALFTVGHHGIEIKGKRIHRKLPQITAFLRTGCPARACLI